MGEMIAIRDAYGAALKELGEQVPNIVCLEADVASSTKSGIFGKANPAVYLLNQLLLKSTANITLIVRAESVEQAQSRIYQQYRYYFEKDSYKANFQRIEFLTGD